MKECTKKCAICENILKLDSRICCSRKCQGIHLAKINRTANYEWKKCEYCGTEYEFNVLCKKVTKYCSRACKDKHLKTKFLGEGNPCFGISPSKETLLLRSQSMKRKWTEPDYRKTIIAAMREFVKEAGYWPGMSAFSQEKRRQTFNALHGTDHNWSVPEIRQKCEDTCIKLYGKYSWEIAKGTYKRNSRIEVIIENILLLLGVSYIHSYNLTVVDITREFDFYLPDKQILIEADGDYWHANPLFFKEKNTTQKHNEENDILKNKLALEANIKLIRFWESDIKADNFINQFRVAINE
jgi:hypothetical protein